MNTQEQILTIGLVVLATFLTRALPFWLFKKRTPKKIEQLGKVLPPAVLGLLVIYSLREQHGLKELIAVLVVVLTHQLKHNFFLSILLGTLIYFML